MKPLRLMLTAIVCLLLISSTQAREIWTKEQANAWAKGKPWFVGCNYITSTAINQLEMWQADSFDPVSIDRELGWAEGLGFTSIRVFLHDLPWKDDREGFLKRIDQFLTIADKHSIGVMFVLFDSCWDPAPTSGKQRAPKQGLHNSGWVQSPGLTILKDLGRHDELEGYVKGIVGHFKNDKRVHVWDLHNEPDNRNNSSYGKLEPENKADLALALLKKTYAWARSVDPSQPLTSGVWIGDWSEAKLTPMARYQLEQSDVISFHDYSSVEKLKGRIDSLKHYERPMLCTEYMARPAGSKFEPNLRTLRDAGVGAYNWGFVDGKSQTIYPWDSWQKPYKSEPPVWFHDIFRANGTAYREAEVKYIRSVTGKK
jgi:hypothetical protein